MSRKHFIAIAAGLRFELENATDVNMRNGVKHAAVAVADVCAGENDRFDRDRFYRACGFNGG